MLCQRCGKNDANVKYTQIINGNKAELLLCEVCSKELGINNIDFSIPISFSSFFGDMLADISTDSFVPKIAKTKELKCNSCNMTYDQFIQSGKFGCSNCYDTFSEKIDPILKRIHGDNKYLGKSIEKDKRRIKN